MAFKQVVLCFLSVIFFTDCFAFNQSCIDTPFLESCLQRNVFNRSYSYVIMPNDLCRIGNQDGLIVLVNIYTGELNSTLSAAKLADLKIQAGENEANNTCLFEHLRPKLSGFPRASNVIVPYQKCSVDNTKGYIVVEYSCLIATDSVLEIPKCSGAVNGSRIRIQNAGFPNTGLNTSEDHCQCTIQSKVKFLNITTYYMRLSYKQTVTIADAHGDGVTYTNISMDRDRNTEMLRVNGVLNLTWTNNETVPNEDNKFWLEIYGNGELISIACEALSRPTTIGTVPTPARTKASPDMVGSTKQTFDSSSNINSTVETTKVPQQGSLPTKYPAQTQLHNELTTTQQRLTKKPDETSTSTKNTVTSTLPNFSSVSSGQSISNIHADITAKGGVSEASKVAEDNCFAFNQSCIDTPFLESCLQRNVFNRSYRYVIMPNDLCRIGNQDGLIVLVNIYTGELNSTLSAAKLADLKIQAGENEANNTCLFEHLRPKLSGFPRASNVIVPYQKCSVDNTKGYIVVEYSCLIATDSVLEIPKCSGAVNGSRIRIQNAGFPNTGLNTSEDHCQCTIQSKVKFLNITTYYMRLSYKQTVTIADAHGDGVTYTNISMDRDRNTEMLRVNGVLNLTWTNNETVPNEDNKFWLEIYGNGELISIACEVLSRPTTIGTVPTPARTKASPDMVGSTKQTFDSSSNINSTVETTKVPQQGSLPTKYPAQTQLHNELTTTQQRLTKKPDETSTSTKNTVTSTLPNFSSVSSGQSISNIHADITAKGGVSEASKVAEDSKTGIPFIRVVVTIIAVLLIVALLITAILVYKKKQRAKLKDKRKDDNTDDRKEDGASNKPSCEDLTGPDDAKTRPKPFLPLLGVPRKIQPIGNSSFDLRRLPPVNTDTQRQNNLNIAVVSDGLMTEGPENIVEKKKKRKKKRRKKTTIYPETEECRKEETVFTETATNLE